MSDVRGIICVSTERTHTSCMHGQSDDNINKECLRMLNSFHFGTADARYLFFINARIVSPC